MTTAIEVKPVKELTLEEAIREFEQTDKGISMQVEAMYMSARLDNLNNDCLRILEKLSTATRQLENMPLLRKGEMRNEKNT